SRTSTGVLVVSVLLLAGVSAPKATVLLRVPSEELVKETATGSDPVTVIVPVCAKAAGAIIATMPKTISSFFNETIMVPPWLLVSELSNEKNRFLWAIFDC